MGINEVAKKAGVSFSTVARVINRHPLVAEETAEKVRNAMKALNYVPPTPANRRGPRTAKNQGFRTRNIASLLVSMSNVHLQSMTAPGPLADALTKHGLNLIYVPMQDPSRLPSIIALKHVDGVIVQGMEPVGKADESLRKLPAVWMMTRRSNTYWSDYVQPDNEANGRMAAQHLLSLGHRRLGLINLQPNYPAFSPRCKAFTDFARSQGVTVKTPQADAVDTSPILRIDGTKELVEKQVQGMLDSKPRPTGIYITSDSPLGIVYRELQKRGLRVGKDLDLIVGDSIRMDLYHPSPSSIDVQIPLIAERAVEQLIWRIRHPDAPGPVGTTIPPVLVIPGESRKDGTHL